MQNQKCDVPDGLACTACDEHEGFLSLEPRVPSNQSIAEFDFQQTCLRKLRAQREKIEELAQLYKQNETCLLTERERVNKLKSENQELSDLKEYKGKFDKLKKDYDALVKQNQVTENDLANAKKEFAEDLQATEQIISRLKGEVKAIKEKNKSVNYNWQNAVQDKQDELDGLVRSHSQEKFVLNEEIAKLKEEISQLKSDLQSKEEEMESEREFYNEEINLRQGDLLNLEKVLESYKKQNADHRKEICGLKEEIERISLEGQSEIEKLLIQHRAVKKESKQRELLIFDLKDMLKKCDGKNVGLEETVNSLKQSMKKFKDYSEGNLKQLIEDSEAERVRLEGIIEELKSSFEEALTQKDLLDNDNKKLRTIIEKKDQQERQRKQMLIDEFREIDKLDRIVRRM